MNRRDLVFVRQLYRALYQRGAPGFFPTRTGQQPAARCRSKGHRRLKLGVISAACTLIGVRPVVIENVLTLAVPLCIKRRDCDHLSVTPRDEVANLPTGARPDGSRRFKGAQKPMRRERVIRPSAIRRLRARARVPLGGINLLQSGENFDFDLCATVHGASADRAIVWIPLQMGPVRSRSIPPLPRQSGIRGR